MTDEANEQTFKVRWVYTVLSPANVPIGAFNVDPDSGHMTFTNYGGIIGSAEEHRQFSLAQLQDILTRIENDLAGVR